MLYEASCAVVEAAIDAGRAVARAAAAADYGALAEAAGGAAKLAVAAAEYSAEAAKSFGTLIAPALVAAKEAGVIVAQVRSFLLLLSCWLYSFVCSLFFRHRAGDDRRVRAIDQVCNAAR